MKESFDAAFLDNLERRIGCRQGIKGLTLNLVNVTSLILLTERLSEEEAQIPDGDDRFTRLSLFKELAEMGLLEEGDGEEILDDLIRKGYATTAQDGSLRAQRPAISMTRLLERAYPGMPGMTLIASLAQTVDEVRSGRKSLEAAIRVFNGILDMPAPSHLRERPQRAHPEGTPSRAPKGDPAPAGPPVHPPPARKRKQKLSDNYRIVSTRPSIATPLLPPESDAGQVPYPGNPDEAPPPEPAPLSEAPSANAEGRAVTEPATGTQGHEEDDGESREENTEGIEMDRDGGDASSGHGEAGEDSVPTDPPPLEVERSQAAPGPPPDPSPDAPRPSADGAPGAVTTPPQNEDLDVEKRILEVEEELSLQCPLCGTGSIRENKTSTGRVFFRCSEAACTFISWGKPYHIPCPRCQNPFLIEVTRRSGRSYLKCPRATCGHWQALPKAKGSGEKETQGKKPRRRVVRRRVVRRKKG